MTELTRRDLMRGLSLAVLAVAAADLLGGCSGDDKDEGDSVDGITLVSSDEDRAEGDSGAVPAVVGSIQALGAGLYRKLRGQPGNLALSPFSVALALALTVNGAKGATLEEMQTVLSTRDLHELNGGLNSLTRHLESLAGKQERRDGSEATIALDSANAIFGEQTETWERGFLDTLAREYGAGLQAVDFKSAAEAARLRINDWVAGRTHDRIEDLIAEGVLDTFTRLVLVNALYLKAPWEEPFNDRATQAKPFHVADGSPVAVPTMRAMLGRAGYGHGDGWQAVRLAYAGNELAMTVLLPDQDRLADLEATIGSGDLPSVLASVEPASVDLSLPRWTFRTQAPLGDTLASLGMPTAFTDGADFSAMTADEPLQIAAVLHQVFIAVDEDGTEAAAATAVVIRATSARFPDRTVVVDRPFLFVIHDVAHGTPLFVGRVSDPRG
ncbi:serpin family protein [Nocardioides sp.]|uniref:serpin family protein n=1 Tax=Nocardioides sp. TaxID=35761 RepID=UPI0031FE441A|nr:proteinase inhibitor serpin [Nocardioides sp.]